MADIYTGMAEDTQDLEEQIAQALDELVEEGLVEETEEDGELFYSLTDEGREYVEEEILGN